MEERATLESPNAAPWLVFSYGEEKEDDNSMPNCKYGDCFLWNPLTLETIQLPSLLRWITCQRHGEYMTDCVLSSPPRTTAISANINKDVDTDVNDPLVLVIYQSMSDFGGAYTFLFCHPGEKQWRTQFFSGRINGGTCEVSDLHCFKNKLYALGINGDCLEIEKQNQVDDNVSLSIKSFKVDVDYRSYFPLRGARDTFEGRTYFVEGHEDLFMIDINFNDRGSERVIVSISVTRLDFDLKEWKLVNSLGYDVLFLGRKNRVCYSAAKLGLARGCLYYTHPSHQFGRTLISPVNMRLYKFEVEDAVDYDISPFLRLPEPVFTPDWIMMPDGQDRKEAGEWSINEGDQNYISKARGNKYGDSKNESAEQFVRRIALKLEEEEEQERGWGILNEDMVVLIASYLHPLDYVNFRSVCKANRQIIPVVRSTLTSNQVLKTTYISPWLLFCRDNSSTVYNFVNPMHDNENLMTFSELLLGAIIRYQKGGWLLMSREDELFFYNPFTREIIVLPDYPGWHDTSDICFFSIPTSSGCMVIGIQRPGSTDDTPTIRRIRRGEHKWDIFYFHEESYSPLCNTPTSFGWKFYSVGYDGTLGYLENGCWNWEILEPHQQFNAHIQVSWWSAEEIFC